MVKPNEIFDLSSMEIFAQVRGELLSEGVEDFTADEATERSTIVSVMKQRTKDFSSSVHNNGNRH